MSENPPREQSSLLSAQRGDSMSRRFREQAASALADAEQESKGAHLDNPPAGAWNEQRHLDVVQRALPTLNGRTLREIVRDYLRPTVWDLGSGDRAVALSELVAQNADLPIIGIGVTLPVEREQVVHPKNVVVVRDDVDHFLRNFDITKRPNVIYTSKFFRWVPHPYSTLKQAYAALAEGGVLLIDEIFNAQTPLLDAAGKLVEPSKLGEYLKEQGYEAELTPLDQRGIGVSEAYKLAIRKTHGKPRLKLPLKLVTPEAMGIDLDKFSLEENPLDFVPLYQRYFYRFDQTT